MTLRSLVLALALTVAVGCGDDEGSGATTTAPELTTATTSTTSTTSSTASTTGVELGQTCTSADGGYAVEYPTGWSTNEGDVTEPCRFFHPEPFEVPQATEVFGLAVTIGVEPVPFERVGAPDGMVEEELSREETTVAGRPAVVVETESTGEGLLPEGVRSYRYAVDLDGRTLVAVTRDVEGLDYGRNQDVLDAMMESLEVVAGS